VRLVYLQPIEIDSGVGRYVYPLEEGEIDENEMRFWERRDALDGVFAFEATVRSSYPLDDVRVKGLGQASVIQEEGGDWKVWIDDEQGATRLNEDLVLYYRLAPDQPARVDLLPYRTGEGPGTFMMVVTPGTDLQPTTAGVDWTIVLDVSGSMSTKIATAADAVSRALTELRPQDRFRIVTFANDAMWITKDWTPVDEQSVQRAADRVKQLGARGGTNLYGGFRAGLGGLDGDRPNAVVVVSDGGANIGPTEHHAFLKLLDQTDVRVFTFVMGQGANRPLLGRLAEESGGFSMDVSNQDDLYGRLMQARAKLGRQALHGVKLELDGVGLADAAPRRLPSAYFGQQIVMFGRYSRPGKAELRLSGRISGEQREWSVPIDLPRHDDRFPEIERLWAFQRIRDLQKSIHGGEPESEYRDAIVEVAREYSIVSDYTSMVVVCEERFEEMGIERKNRRRTETERQARASRAQSPVSATRVDGAQPMFGEQPAHGTSTGTGAVGPWFLGVLLGLGGLRAWRARRRDRS
jgi:Ca-activated chloride channel family protein